MLGLVYTVICLHAHTYCVWETAQAYFINLPSERRENQTTANTLLDFMVDRGITSGLAASELHVLALGDASEEMKLRPLYFIRPAGHMKYPASTT